MSDAAITNIVTGVVTVVTLLVGFGTLWVKLRYGVKKVEEAADNAGAAATSANTAAINAGVAVVKANTNAASMQKSLTHSTNLLNDNTAKTEKVVKQTDCLLDAMREEIRELRAEIRSLRDEKAKRE